MLISGDFWYSFPVGLLTTAWDEFTNIRLITFMWMTIGKMYLGAVVSSTVVIGVVSADNCCHQIVLSADFAEAGPENLLKDKSFSEKMALTLRFLLVFSHSVLFRSGACLVFLMDYHTSTFISTLIVITLQILYLMV